AGLDAEFGDFEVHAQFDQQAGDVVVLAHAHAAGDEEGVELEAVLQGGTNCVGIVDGAAEVRDVATEAAEKGDEHRGITIADLRPLRDLRYRDELVAGGEHGDARVL